MKKKNTHGLIVVALGILGLMIFVTNGFGNSLIRNYGGDIVAVMFVYFFIRSVFCLRSTSAALITLLIAINIELFQIFRFRFIENPTFRQLVAGSTFDIVDFVMYMVGVAFSVFIDRRVR